MFLQRHNFIFEDIPSDKSEVETKYSAYLHFLIARDMGFFIILLVTGT